MRFSAEDLKGGKSSQGTESTVTAGHRYEKLAAKLLSLSGYDIVEMNYRKKFGEIDIIAKEGGCLVFVEVKYRQSSYAGLPCEAVDIKKQKHIIKTAQCYIDEKALYCLPVRFDVVEILGDRYRITKDAFVL